jgi:hypothetical protein
MPTFMMNALSSSAFHFRGEYGNVNERIELFRLFWSLGASVHISLPDVRCVSDWMKSLDVHELHPNSYFWLSINEESVQAPGNDRLRTLRE